MGFSGENWKILKLNHCRLLCIWKHFTTIAQLGNIFSSDKKILRDHRSFATNFNEFDRFIFCFQPLCDDAYRWWLDIMVLQIKFFARTVNFTPTECSLWELYTKWWPSFNFIKPFRQKKWYILPNYEKHTFLWNFLINWNVFFLFFPSSHNDSVHNGSLFGLCWFRLFRLNMVGWWWCGRSDYECKIFIFRIIMYFLCTFQHQSVVLYSI